VPRDEAGLPDSRILQPQVLLPTSSPHEHDKGRTSDCLAGSDSDSETEPSLASQRRYIVAIQTHLGSLDNHVSLASRKTSTDADR
jgi:hypothetical protein